MKTKTENTLAWFVCKLFARRGRDEGVQQKELCVQLGEVNDVAMLLVSPYVRGNPHIYFSVFSCHVHPPQKSCTSKGATEKKSRAYIRP